MAKQKVKRFVIDVNSFITIFITKDTDWLLKYIAQNKLEIFIDDSLLSELARVLHYPKIQKLLPFPAVFYLSFVKLISTQVLPKPIEINCPDPADNYLFILALSTHSKLLITGDKHLLTWKDSPVDMIPLAQFKRLY